jgi:hypothetical protein
MHGEYKVPEGKLVVIDLDSIDGTLRNVQLSGDFFLSPDEALEWITAAIEGQSEQITELALAEQIRTATSDAELLGITPEGIVTAVQRAIRGTS